MSTNRWTNVVGHMMECYSTIKKGACCQHTTARMNPGKEARCKGLRAGGYRLYEMARGGKCAETGDYGCLGIGGCGWWEEMGSDS